MSWVQCPQCNEGMEDGDFGADAYCRSCDKWYETDWDYMDAFEGTMAAWVTREIDRASVAVVRMEDTPIYATWLYLRAHGREYGAINPLVYYLIAQPPIRLRHVKVHIEKWRGVYGSAGR